MKILIIDNEPFVLRFLEELLGRHGHECDGLLNPGQALARIAAHTYDLVISDIDMPCQSGLDLLAEIRAVSPDLPVILTTGSRDPEYEQRSLELRASYLEKPFSGAHLLDTMASSLSSEPPGAAL